MNGYNDSYIEESVHRKISVLSRVFYFFLIFLSFLAMILAFAGYLLMWPVTLMLGLGAFIVSKTLVVDYDYTATNGHVDIDRIRNKERTKRVASVPAEHLILLAPADHPEARPYTSLKGKDYTTRDENDKVFMLVYTTNEGNRVLYFNPSDAFINSIKRYKPRNVFF